MRFSDATKASREALRLDRNSAMAWCELGLGERGLGHVDAAIDFFKRALALRESKEILTLLANLQLARSPREAAVTARRALAIDPDWEEAAAILKAAEDHGE